MIFYSYIVNKIVEQKEKQRKVIEKQKIGEQEGVK
jgi:hypothetical protein